MILIIAHRLILIVKKNLVSLEGPTDGINDSTSAARKTLNFSKVKTKFCLSLHCSGDECYIYVNKMVFCKFEANDKISWYNFCLGSESKDFTKDEPAKFF